MEIETLKQYLEFIHKAYNGYSRESYVLARGKEYQAPKIARPAGIRKGRNKLCFMNAFRLADTGNYRYVEGFANSIIPVHHAWVIDGDGNVIETTWKTPGTEYYGVEFPQGFIHKIMLETKTYGVIDFSSPTFREHFAEVMRSGNVK